MRRRIGGRLGSLLRDSQWGRMARLCLRRAQPDGDMNRPFVHRMALGDATTAARWDAFVQACPAATFGLEQAVNAIKSGSAKCVLVINPEITSGHQEWKDRDCHFIFGDVATATIVERADTATSSEQWEVLGSKLATQFSNNIRNNFGYLNRSEDSDPTARDKTFRQEGRKVFKEVVPIAAAHIESELTELGLAAADVRRYWLHQANLSMNQLIVKRLTGGEVTPDVAPLILDEYANTSSAGSIIAFHLHKSDLASGDVGVICSFGAGYSVGCVVVRKR